MSTPENRARVSQGDATGPEETIGIELVAADRVVVFSDAVVAIAITLLALDLYVPVHVSSDTTIVQDARAHYLNYLGFLISFLVIARHWRSHHRLFAGVTRLTSRLITLNFLWLLMIVITPFATRLLTLNGNGFRVGFSFYAAVQVVTLLSFLLLMRQLQDSKLRRAQESKQATEDNELALITAAAMFVISIPFAFLVHDWAFAFWAASPYVTRFIRRLRRKPG